MIRRKRIDKEDILSFHETFYELFVLKRQNQGEMIGNITSRNNVFL